jgi:phosphoglycolate phosphatase
MPPATARLSLAGAWFAHAFARGRASARRDIFLFRPAAFAAQRHSREADVVDAVLFDFDLTLADSTAGVTECTNFALRALGFDEAQGPAIRATIGLPLAQSFTVLTGNSDPTLAANFAHHFVQRADDVMADLTEIYAAVPRVFSDLRARSRRTGIVSTKFRYRIEEILRRSDLLALVDAIVGGEDVTVQKPDPSGILKILSTLSVSARRTLYVGDHQVDAITANAAGVDFVGVLTGATDRARFAQVHAHDVLDSVAEVPSHLLQRYPVAV